jgi:hypothetical protein
VHFQVTYFGNTTLFHGVLNGNPVGKLTLLPGDRLTSMFGTSSSYLNSVGFTTDKGFAYGPWGNWKQGSTYQFNGVLTGFFGSIRNQSLATLGVWADDGTTVPPPPRPSPPSPRGSGFDTNEPCPDTQLLGSGIDYRLMENQVRQTVVGRKFPTG